VRNPAALRCSLVISHPWASAAEAERSVTLLRNGIGGYCASGNIVVANG
jgi:hypothetical protein